jgi:hypothetical protein
MVEHKLGAYKKIINYADAIKLKSMGSIYSKFDINGRKKLEGYNPT